MKALLGQAEDVSHLPEYDFSMLNSFSRNRAYYIVGKAAPEKHLILKKPRWFTEKHYPSPPPLDCQVIVLYRDVQGVVNSLMKRWPDLTQADAIDYWCETYTDILKNLRSFPSDNVHYTHYQDLLDNPVQTTARIFKFIGSKQSTGVSEYSFPDSGKWEWGKDDGSGNIYALSVKAKKPASPQMLVMNEVTARTDIHDLSNQYESLIEQSRTLP